MDGNSQKAMATVSRIKNRFLWDYENILKGMLRSFDNRTIRETLESALKKRT